MRVAPLLICRLAQPISVVTPDCTRMAPLRKVIADLFPAGKIPAALVRSVMVPANDSEEEITIWLIFLPEFTFILVMGVHNLKVGGVVTAGVDGSKTPSYEVK